MLNCLAALGNGANRCMPLYKIPSSAGSYALWAKCIYVLEQNDALQRTENYAESIAALLKDKHPALLLAATKRGKALAARLSVQLNAALVNDALAVDIVDGHICAEHRMYGGLAFAQEKINSPLAIITLAPGVQEPCTRDISHQCPTETVPYVARVMEILCRERRAKAASSVNPEQKQNVWLASVVVWQRRMT